ncbi:MAG: winged helix-turn-helix transcriptional regulator [Methylobacteriaceae bacterium]|nr:winged helix-turn-helix transcriptional regulator [Methylobacteriaceae bacterium]
MLLSQVRAALQAGFLARLARAGFIDLTPALAALMPALDAEGSIRAADLAKRVGLTKQALSQSIQELVTRGYLEQVRDPHDARAKLIRLAPRGSALRAAGLAAKAEMAERLLGQIGPGTAARLAEDLRALLAALAANHTMPR